ncbi:hypothetical protein Ddye_016759 [Dipteronia dyeriana]|uniref:Uncharacterized protein n=1 Tax=Dipteronia dyeriana TaxID=168575 RepID=A0AAD9U898_9ROSI|nr:hypothetical protein Ddye_016759 [Dipteronia dyeriana]
MLLGFAKRSLIFWFSHPLFDALKKLKALSIMARIEWFNVVINVEFVKIFLMATWMVWSARNGCIHGGKPLVGEYGWAIDIRNKRIDIGCVFRGGLRNILVISVLVFSGSFGAELAKVKAILKDLKLANKRGFLSLEVESDAINIVNGTGISLVSILRPQFHDWNRTDGMSKEAVGLGFWFPGNVNPMGITLPSRRMMMTTATTRSYDDEEDDEPNQMKAAATTNKILTRVDGDGGVEARRRRRQRRGGKEMTT